MQLRRLLLACIAVSFATFDLAHKSLATEFHHAHAVRRIADLRGDRSASRVRATRPSMQRRTARASRAAVQMGELISLFAFNFADLFALTGDVLIISAIVVYGLRNALGSPAGPRGLIQATRIVSFAPASHDLEEGEQP